jgi:hypothetical protein
MASEVAHTIDMEELVSSTGGGRLSGVAKIKDTLYKARIGLAARERRIEKLMVGDKIGTHGHGCVDRMKEYAERAQRRVERLEAKRVAAEKREMDKVAKAEEARKKMIDSIRENFWTVLGYSKLRGKYPDFVEPILESEAERRGLELYENNARAKW